MTIDRKSLGYSLIIPSIFIIAVVFISLLFLIGKITDTVQSDYNRFAISAVSSEVQKVISTAAAEITTARLAENAMVITTKQKSVLEELALLWARLEYDGLITDSGGDVLFTTLAVAPDTNLFSGSSVGYYEVDGSTGKLHCYAIKFPLWGWKLVTISRHESSLLSRNKTVVLIPLVAAGCILMVGGIFLVLRKTLRDPVRMMVSAVAKGEPVEPTGVTEFDIVGNAVNDAFQRLRERTETLQEKLEERARVQTQMRLKDEHIHRLLSFTEEGIFGVDVDGTCTFCNRSCLDLLGYEREEQLLGTPILELIHHSHPDGTPCPRHKCAILQGLLDGENVHNENEVFWRSDGSTLQVEYWSHIITGAGRTAGAVVTFIDISQRKLLEDQLIQAQKMESVGCLAGGIAHDFNNLLTPIIGYADLLKLSLAGNEKELSKIDIVLQAAEKAKELVKQLLSFSRKQVLEIRTIDLNQTLVEFISILQHTVRESIVIRLNLADKVYGIRADGNQIEQVIMNLAVNAQDAIGERGVITIETAPVLLDDEYARQYPDVTPGKYLMLAVTDDGCGMDLKTQQRIFEPFFTTKGVGHGTGLGLSTVYGIVRQHGGNLSVCSEPGKGTTFKCYFPLVEEMPESEQHIVRSQVSLEGEQRIILLVEDNEMVRKFVEGMLTRQGFEVLVAEHPQEALQLVESRSLDLLITDVVMPHMSGPELHATLLESYPGLKVLYMSGYTSNAITLQESQNNRVKFLQKPFGLDDFFRKIEAVLAS